MNKIFMHPKKMLTLLVVLIMILTKAFLIESVLVPVVLIAVVGLFTFKAKDRLIHLSDCLYYLMFIGPLVSIYTFNYLYGMSFFSKDLLATYVGEAAYILIWLMLVINAESRALKLATLIMSAGSIVVFFILNTQLTLTPISILYQKFDQYTEDTLYFLTVEYGFTLKEYFAFLLRAFLSPVLIITFLTHVIDQARSYRNNKYKETSIEG